VFLPHRTWADDERITMRGLMAAMANPSPTDKAQSPWARRSMAAHVNAVENLVIFASLVLTARALGIATTATAFACALYFWARLAHVVVYTLGIPVLRTLSLQPASRRRCCWCSRFSN
jgi:uncharacterized MAPEG superfamily protein